MNRHSPSITACLITAFVVAMGCQPAPEPAAESPPAAQIERRVVPAVSPLVAVKNARVPLDGVLTGGQPTEEQIERVALAGYNTVVNLRTDGEEGAWDEEPAVTGLGMRYVSIPVAGVEGITIENAAKLAEVVADEANRPLFIHCGSGNRIGALFAMSAFHLDGEDAEAALAIGRGAGLTRLEPVVQELLTR